MSRAPSSSLERSPREQFDALAREWEEATRFLSSVPQVAMNRSYQRIIGMGPAVLPLIFERMRNRPGHWFWALEAITGENPVEPTHAGALDQMTADWLGWARDHRLVS